ncbi:hypothetical protein P280DRAFT_451151 [Massarina eburnea CBS 473.64]|uniref:Uncharacterized protein n=1 Tax=Massarina eburnea CBS 473.64 TaxID=1395130 RepID=A0A6A6S1Z7_9PLEO|nr:hypothetical protein P280DRAFT_451151 [Massarina eburnea CBS 473.64]
MSGPDCKDIIEFKKSIAGVPSDVKAPFDAISKDALAKVTDPRALTVWETDADIDGLLQLIEVYFKIKAANASSSGGAAPAGTGWAGSGKNGKKKMGMIILSQEKDDRNAYQRIIDLLRYLTSTKGEAHLNGTVCAFDSIVIVRGVNYSKTRTKEEDKHVIKRINTSIDRVLKMIHNSSSSKPKIVWHHGPILSLLLTWINHADDLRSSLSAITITAAVTFTDGLKPSDVGKSNKPSDFQTLERYATKLGVNVLFLDPVTQLIYNEFPSHFIHYFGYYITVFLPHSVTLPHYRVGLDYLTTFAFRLWGATKNTYGKDVVAQVKQHLNGERSQHWARICIDPASYTRAACLSAGEERPLQLAGSLADSPWAMYATSLTTVPTSPLPGFARLVLCPTSSLDTLTATYHAAPISLNYSTSTYKVSNPSPFRLLVPRDGIDIPAMEQRIQGTMTAILTRVMEVKPKLRMGDPDVRVWMDMLGAVNWCLEGCMAGLPANVRGKVEEVASMLTVVGCWGYMVKNRETAFGLGVPTATAAATGPVASMGIPAAPATATTAAATTGWGMGQGQGQVGTRWGFPA